LKTQIEFKTASPFKVFNFLNAPKRDFSIIKFGVLYIVLLQGFYLYVGIISEGGKLFSPFLSRYADFPGWLTMLIARSSKFVLEMTGYSVYQKNAANITITGSNGINIAWACLGAGAISLWIAFIAAHRHTIKYKFKWMVAGFILICLVNILRIIMIILSGYHHWEYWKHFDAHQSFNILTYAVILVFMHVFVRSYTKPKQQEFNAEPHS
jgi:exosortase/archaeosortase family protein